MLQSVGQFMSGIAGGCHFFASLITWFIVKKQTIYFRLLLWLMADASQIIGMQGVDGLVTKKAHNLDSGMCPFWG